jgi:integrase
MGSSLSLSKSLTRHLRMPARSGCLSFNGAPILGCRASSVKLASALLNKIVRAYSGALGFEIGAHALRATAATNALDHQADIAKVQEWLGHANIAATRIYNHRKTRPEDSPTFKVAY